MSRTDLIADTFTMIRNAVMAKKVNLDVPASGVVKAIVDIFKKENYIDNYKIIESKKQDSLRIYLKYIGKKSVITNIKRISRPGRRVFVRRDKIPTVLRGRGMAIISTSSGIITDKEARLKGLGGEVMGYIW